MKEGVNPAEQIEPQEREGTKEKEKKMEKNDKRERTRNNAEHKDKAKQKKAAPSKKDKIRKWTLIIIMAYSQLCRPGSVSGSRISVAPAGGHKYARPPVFMWVAAIPFFCFRAFKEPRREARRGPANAKRNR